MRKGNYLYFFKELRFYLCNNIINRIPFFSIRDLFYKYAMGFSLSKGAAILMGCRFDAKNNFVIGENSVINANCRIDTRGGVYIEDNVSISEDVIILTAEHNVKSPLFEGRNKKVYIKSYAFIGTRATVLPGVVLGKGAVLAAGAVLTKSIPDCEIWAGVPAKKIGVRNPTFNYSCDYRRLLH